MPTEPWNTKMWAKVSDPTLIRFARNTIKTFIDKNRNLKHLNRRWISIQGPICIYIESKYFGRKYLELSQIIFCLTASTLRGETRPKRKNVYRHQNAKI